MKPVSYKNSLLDPKWISLRNKVLTRDLNQCIICNATTDLNVHHTFYFYPLQPAFNYPMDSLVTVCSTCHFNLHCEQDIPIIPL